MTVRPYPVTRPVPDAGIPRSDSAHTSAVDDTGPMNPTPRQRPQTAPKLSVEGGNTTGAHRDQSSTSTPIDTPKVVDGEVELDTETGCFTKKCLGWTFGIAAAYSSFINS